MQDPLLAQWKQRVGRLTDPDRPRAYGAAPPRRAKRGGAATVAKGRGRGVVGRGGGVGSRRASG